MSKSPPAPVRLTLPRPSRDGRAAPGDQLAAQLRYRILTGDLRPGDRLPPVRRLAAFLRVNRNTVARVYRRLEAAGPRRALPPGGAPPPPPPPADLQTLVAMRARPRPARLRVGFVECNTVDLTYFRRLLEREGGAPSRPLLLHPPR